MFPPFPLERAQKYCAILMKQLDEACQNHKMQKKILTVTEKSSYKEDCISEPGCMFGVLVCNNQAGKEIVLKAFSGFSPPEYILTHPVFFGFSPISPGWVPYLFDENQYKKQVERDDGAIQALTQQLVCLQDNGEPELVSRLKAERKQLSRKSLEALYNLYNFTCIDGSVKKFKDFIPHFGGEKGNFPPTGTGDCCAPKLLGYAFSQGFEPVSLAEFYYGKSDKAHTRIHKHFYPPCDEKCGIVLPIQLGLDIVYRDGDMVVVNKPAGLLSVPGRGEENQDSVETRLRRLIPGCPVQPAVHRLDMDTSGLLILALNKESHKALSKQFMEGLVYKEYEALLRGRVVPSAEWNQVCLPFRLDVENRPRQIYDEVHGKIGITDWKVLSYHRCSTDICRDKVLTRVLFVPQTGRTHQLRLHASHEKGLGVAIQGDRLYGTRLEGERLMLHACTIKIRHPETGELLTFTSKVPF